MRLIAALACAMLLICLGTLPGHADKRVALVIGNGAYQNTPALTNPINDAEDMAAALRAVGFEVLVERNVNKRSLEMTIAQFGRIAQAADAALFYYAGHGIQYRGINYLIPIDARLEDEFSVNYELTRIEDVLFALSGARGVKILILDACRNNPLADRLSLTPANRDAAAMRGLARIEAARGMIIAFATQPNQVAVDGTGRNSPFTGALIKEIEQPGLEIATLFRRVAINVDRETSGRQLSELSISMFGEFYLNTHETDAQAWVKIRQSSNIADLENFIRQYPQSFLAADARSRVAVLDREEALRELQQRQLRQQAERERLERERLAQEQAGRERVRREAFAKAEEEQRRAREKLDREIREREQTERERLERERLAQEQAEREKGQRETLARAEEEQRLEREKVDGKRPSTETNTKVVMLPARTEPSAILSSPPPELDGSALIQEIKKELKRVGCYTGRIDDKWTTMDIKASVQKFIKYSKLPSFADDQMDNFLSAVRSKTDRVCPLECGAREVAKDGRCIAKSCTTGSTRRADGTCEPEKERPGTSSPKIGMPTLASPDPHVEPTTRGRSYDSAAGNLSTCSGLKTNCLSHSEPGWPVCNYIWDNCMKSGFWSGTRLSRPAERR